MILADASLSSIFLETLAKQGLLGVLFGAACLVVVKLYSYNQKLYQDRLVDMKNVLDDRQKGYEAQLDVSLQERDKLVESEKHLAHTLHDLKDEINKNQRATLDSVSDVRRQIQEVRDAQVRIESKIDQRRGRNA